MKDAVAQIGVRLRRIPLRGSITSTVAVLFVGALCFSAAAPDPAPSGTPTDGTPADDAVADDHADAVAAVGTAAKAETTAEVGAAPSEAIRASSIQLP